MKELQIRQVHELADAIETEALRGGLALTNGAARTGAATLGKIARLARDLNRVLDGEVPPPDLTREPAEAIEQALDALDGCAPALGSAKPADLRASILGALYRFGPAELSHTARTSPELSQLIVDGLVEPAGDGARGFASSRPLRYQLTEPGANEAHQAYQAEQRRRQVRCPAHPVGRQEFCTYCGEPRASRPVDDPRYQLGRH